MKGSEAVRRLEEKIMGGDALRRPGVKVMRCETV
jgi:hypothetical protein